MWLECRKALEDHEIEPRFCHPMNRKFYQPSSKWVPFSNQRSIRQGRRRGVGSTFHQLSPMKTGLPSFKNGLVCDYPRSTTERSEGPTEGSKGVC